MSGKKARHLTPKERERMVNRIMAHNIACVIEDIDKGRFDYFMSIILGEGYTQPGRMTDAELLDEWREGEYDGPVKDEVVKTSRAYQDYEFVRQLWEDGDRSGLHCDAGFFPVGSRGYKKHGGN